MCIQNGGIPAFFTNPKTPVNFKWYLGIQRYLFLREEGKFQEKKNGMNLNDQLKYFKYIYIYIY